MTGLRRRVPGRSRADISSRADVLRQHLKLLSGERVDAFPVVDYVEFILPQVFEDFVLEIVEDKEMPGMEGATWPDRMRMQLPRSVYERAAANDGRSRFTMSHELGHLLLHRGIPFAREMRSSEFGESKVSDIATFECSEWQANEFAAALLMPASLVRECPSVRDVMERFSVSKAAAEARLKVLKMVKPRGW